jgi:hypothetical protein
VHNADRHCLLHDLILETKLTKKEKRDLVAFMRQL